MRTLADRTRTRKPPRRILLTDGERLADPLPAIARLAAGDAVIVRHYGDPERAAMVRAAVEYCRPRKISVLVAADARLALAADADGVHMPEAMLARAPARWRRRLRPGMWLSAAAHSPGALARAAALDADFALLSPVFPTDSHPGASCIGVLRFAAWVAGAGLPVLALGGVNKTNARRVMSAGAHGWAAIAGLTQ